MSGLSYYQADWSIGWWICPSNTFNFDRGADPLS